MAWACSVLVWAWLSCWPRRPWPAAWAWKARKGYCKPMACGSWGGVGNSGRDGTGSLDQGADCRRSAGLGTLAVQLKPGSPHRGRLALALGMVAGVTSLDVYCARLLRAESWQARALKWDYRDRSGWSRPPSAMRGIARDTVPQKVSTPHTTPAYH